MPSYGSRYKDIFDASLKVLSKKIGIASRHIIFCDALA